MNIDPDDDNWLYFFQQYKNLPELWDSSHEGYNYNEIRNQAWRKLLEVYRNIDPNATLDRLKQKVHNLRCAYRRELKKMERGEWEHPDTEHTSSLWYFDYLDFLRQQPNIPNSLGDEHPLIKSVEKEDSSYAYRNKRRKIDSSPDDGDRYEPVQHDRLLPKDLEEHEEHKDDADIYGESWACCFRKLTEEQQLYAKKVIDEVLVLGQLEKLTIDTTVASSAYLSSNLVSPYSSVMLTSQPPSEDSTSLQDENILYENHNYTKKEYYFSSVQEALNMDNKSLHNSM